MRIRLTAGVVAACAVSSLLVPAPANAASAVQIYRAYFDSPGKDTRTNASLNGEWVQLHNRSKTARSLTGWKLRDKTGYTYTFGTYTLAAGKTVKVRTGSGTDTKANRYWGRRAYVWNNTGDTAYLLTKSGALADKCSWNSKGPSKYC
ncbi:lamin tail domain-containing protein [Actinomadura flavalba]|uniref:lamin tail domain-containing protein n=1 Tax=Actinomadura flavalba TaxID=1120938 RepID=UPI0003A25218|nr:lamin tail domain-containing protein [Actinomadura flavalba]